MKPAKLDISVAMLDVTLELLASRLMLVLTISFCVRGSRDFFPHVDAKAAAKVCDDFIGALVFLYLFPEFLFDVFDVTLESMPRMERTIALLVGLPAWLCRTHFQVMMAQQETLAAQKESLEILTRKVNALYSDQSDGGAQRRAASPARRRR